jgi:NAD(P)-dependent dehydrogenase (short-subunit alcohol dehydrogenase family)
VGARALSLLSSPPPPPPQLLVNNAGIYRNGKRLHEFSEEDLDVCFDVNAKGTFFGAQEAIKRFLA